MNIKVDNYQIKVSNSFGEFRANEDFCDVTLACDDNEQIEAHKVILSASSSFFRNILKKNSHSHPLLYLRGITRTDLLNVIDFIYHGEASIAQEDFKRFMSIAEDLKLVGLSENTSLKIPSEKIGTPSTDDSKTEADSSKTNLSHENTYEEFDLQENDAEVNYIKSALDKYLEDELNKGHSKTEESIDINYKDFVAKDESKLASKSRGKNHFKASWLEKLDANGDKIGTYLEEFSEFSVKCRWCSKVLQIDNLGIALITRHCKSQKHVEKSNWEKENPLYI